MDILYAGVGAGIAFWILYSLIALVGKHKIAIITTTSLGFIAGISSIVARGSYITLIGTIIGLVCVLTIIPIQIRSQKKEIWKKNKQNLKQK